MDESYAMTWRKQMRSVMGRSAMQQKKDYSKRYFVNDYYLSVKRNDWAAGRSILACLDIAAGKSVLDVGCGPGTVAIPLAMMGNSVTALDPSVSMLEIVKKVSEELSLSNITTVNTSLEELDISKYSSSFDVVLSSFSLMVEDIVDALFRLHTLSSEKVAIVWHDSMGTLEQIVSKIWEKLTGIEYVMAPSSLTLYNILCGMGIFPDVNHSYVSYTFSYASIDDAVKSVVTMNGLPIEDDEEYDMVKEDLAPFIGAHGGSYDITYTTPASFITWDVHKQSPGAR